MGMCFGGTILTQPRPRDSPNPFSEGKTLETKLIFTQYVAQT